ncbi:MAG: hypothetical protein LC725_10360 [Lentisphaerae bacterium]|nr:hypothetical protein [Lentisphaerota bacterium]
MSENIHGQIVFPLRWHVAGPVEAAIPAPAPSDLKRIPDTLEIGGQILRAVEVVPTRNQYDFRALFGEPPYSVGRAVYVFVPLDSPVEQTVTLGIGADWFVQVWLDGDFTSILPPRRTLDASDLFREYPSDPEAPLRWTPPSGFDPNAADLGMPPLHEAEHVELFHALRSQAPVDDGGTGVYESRRHGTWNHVARVAVFGDRLIAYWRNHAMDEGGPSTRILGRVGRILSAVGEVDWGRADDLIEPAPAPVPVRRRKLHGDRDAVRGAAARGTFCLIGGRLFFCGYLVAKHGFASDPAFGIVEGNVGGGRRIPSQSFNFGPGPATLGQGNVEWDLGFRFYQEWGIREGRFEPLSPLYKENELPATLPMTPDLALPLEPLVAPYADAPLLSAAPSDVQELIRQGARQSLDRAPRYRPGTKRLAHDGHNGLAHETEFQRPDGSWVSVRDNQKPCVQPFYYAAEKPDAESYYPSARRTNLYGAVNPAAGELPDGRVFIVGNSPRRRSMFIYVSRDGRLFDRTWFLLHRQVKDYTPGAMKREGGPGSGPQYFVSAVVGGSLWLIYSLCKEHVGATRVPLAAL